MSSIHTSIEGPATESVGSRPPPPRTHTHPSPRWPIWVACVVVAVQALDLTRGLGNAGFGSDFQLLYTVATAWGAGRDAYDDDVIKQTWAAHGDSSLPSPGRPVTPNVYPLCIAPLIWPFTLVNIHTAMLIWIAILLACEAWLLVLVLRSAIPPPAVGEGAGAAAEIRLIPVTLAVGVLVLCYPMRLNLASLNIALIAGTAGLWATLNAQTRPWRAGLLLGAALVKYSLTGPLVIWLIWRKRWTAIGVAIAAQAALVVVATAVGPYAFPLYWLDHMRAEMAASLATGGINAHDTFAGSAMLLHVRALWYRLMPGYDAWHWAILVGLVYLAGRAVGRSPLKARDESVQRDAACRADLAWIILLTCVAFYHRAYDLVPPMALVLSGLVSPRGDAQSVPARTAAWALLLVTVLPGLWDGWDGVDVSQWTFVLIQPACAWATVGLALLAIWDRLSARVPE